MVCQVVRHTPEVYKAQRSIDGSLLIMMHPCNYQCTTSPRKICWRLLCTSVSLHRRSAAVDCPCYAVATFATTVHELDSMCCLLPLSLGSCLSTHLRPLQHQLVSYASPWLNHGIICAEFIDDFPRFTHLPPNAHMCAQSVMTHVRKTIKSAQSWSYTCKALICMVPHCALPPNPGCATLPSVACTS